MQRHVAFVAETSGLHVQIDNADRIRRNFVLLKDKVHVEILVEVKIFGQIRAKIIKNPRSCERGIFFAIKFELRSGLPNWMQRHVVFFAITSLVHIQIDYADRIRRNFVLLKDKVHVEILVEIKIFGQILER